MIFSNPGNVTNLGIEQKDRAKAVENIEALDSEVIVNPMYGGFDDSDYIDKV